MSAVLPAGRCSGELQGPPLPTELLRGATQEPQPPHPPAMGSCLCLQACRWRVQVHMRGSVQGQGCSAVHRRRRVSGRLGLSGQGRGQEVAGVQGGDGADGEGRGVRQRAPGGARKSSKGIRAR